MAGWQCKGGATQGSLGGESIQVHRASGRRDDDSLPNILARAEKGFLKLARSLITSCTNVDTRVHVRLQSLVITTTKGCTSNARATLTTDRSRYTVPATLAAAEAAFSAAEYSACAWTYTVVLHDGVQWMLDVLEPALRELWPLHARR